MSPRKCVPFCSVRSRPPASSSTSPFLMVSWPWMEGARLRPSCSITSSSPASSCTVVGWADTCEGGRVGGPGTAHVLQRYCTPGHH